MTLCFFFDLRMQNVQQNKMLILCKSTKKSETLFFLRKSFEKNDKKKIFNHTLYRGRKNREKRHMVSKIYCEAIDKL